MNIVCKSARIASNIVCKSAPIASNIVCKCARIASTLRSTLIGANVCGTRTAHKSEAPHLMSNEFLTASFRIFEIIKKLDIMRTFSKFYTE